MTTDRQEFLAALPKSARKTLAAIEYALAGNPSIAITYDRLAAEHGIGRATLRYSLRILQATGLIAIASGRNRVSVFAPSDVWQTLSEARVARGIAEARLPRPVKGRNRTRPPKPPKQPKVMVEAEPVCEPVQYQTPSLPKLRFMEGWEG